MKGFRDRRRDVSPDLWDHLRENRSRTVSCHIARSGAAPIGAVIRKEDRRKNGNRTRLGATLACSAGYNPIFSHAGPISAKCTGVKMKKFFTLGISIIAFWTFDPAVGAERCGATER